MKCLIDVNVKKDGSVIRRDDRVEWKDGSSFDRRKKGVTAEDVVDTLRASRVTCTGVGSMKVLNGVTNIELGNDTI